MKNAAIVLFLILPSTILAGGAVYMASTGVSAWTWVWFLLAALVMGGVTVNNA